MITHALQTLRAHLRLRSEHQGRNNVPLISLTTPCLERGIEEVSYAASRALNKRGIAKMAQSVNDNPAEYERRCGMESVR